MRRSGAASRPLASYSAVRSWAVCITNMCRSNLRQAQVYGAAVTRRLRAMGIRDKPIAPGSPWQNGFAERLSGSIRRECVDHIVALGEGYLRRVLQSYARYYNGSQTHRALNKDAPHHRAIESLGTIISRPVLDGLHHRYCRI